VSKIESGKYFIYMKQIPYIKLGNDLEESFTTIMYNWKCPGNN
jgi:hypothetical protein